MTALLLKVPFSFRCTINTLTKISFQAEGFDVIACVAVNDPYVMSAWAQSLKTKDKVRVVTDVGCR